MPSILQLVKRVLPSGSTVIGGETGLYNEVSWVIVLRPTPPGFDGLKGNEFVIIGTDVAAGLGVTLTYLISTLAERGASGIGILGEISKEAEREAQSGTIPLIQLAPQTNISTLENAITRLIGEERQLLYQKERELSHSLMEFAVAGGGSLAIIQRLKELAGRNLGFIDLNYNPHFPMDEQLIDSFKKQVTKALSKLRSESSGLATPVIGLTLSQKQACFLGLIRVGKEIKGYLMLIAPEDTISDIDRLAVRMGTMALAVEMSRRQAVEETESRFESDIIEDLLTSELSETEADEIAKRLNLNLSISRACIIIRPSVQPTEPAIVLKNIANLYSKAHCYFRSSDIVILYPLESLKTVVELRKIGNDVLDRLTPVIAGVITLGIGRSYSGAEGIRHSFLEAEQAVAMGIQLFGTGSVTCFADLGIYRLLFSLKSTGELVSFFKANLGSLVDYDKKHDGELTQTLKVYLHHNAIADTARAIHVHRNTLLYRLSRIKEITGADLEDGETRLTLYLAVLAGEILQAS